MRSTSYADRRRRDSHREATRHSDGHAIQRTRLFECVEMVTARHEMLRVPAAGELFPFARRGVDVVERVVVDGVEAALMTACGRRVRPGADELRPVAGLLRCLVERAALLEHVERVTDRGNLVR